MYINIKFTASINFLKTMKFAKFSVILNAVQKRFNLSDKTEVHQKLLFENARIQNKIGIWWPRPKL